LNTKKIIHNDSSPTFVIDPKNLGINPRENKSHCNLDCLHLYLSILIKAYEMNKQLASEDFQHLLATIQQRFEKNRITRNSVSWIEVEDRLKAHPNKWWSLNEMEKTGGEPDVISVDPITGELLFCDCSAESPSGRRSLCYDPEALAARKDAPPKGSAIGLALEMGIELLSDEDYRMLQGIGKFDLKTSSWIQTPKSIRELGGALFCDRRYDEVFTYHNGAQSYYAARGFRGLLRI
jgi:hypothetical protein